MSECIYPTFDNLGPWGVFFNEVSRSKSCTHLKWTPMSDMSLGVDLRTDTNDISPMSDMSLGVDLKMYFV